jgi:hypothetical protein
MKLEPIEVSLLESLFEQLEAVLDGGPGDGGEDIRARLSPAAYPDDSAADAEFRTLTADTLREVRDERLAGCRADLAHGNVVHLNDADAVRRWVQVLNDLRLTFGTKLDVSEDDAHDFDSNAPDAQLRAVYHWLTAMQDAVVGELLR